jgi:hypothetical protein
MHFNFKKIASAASSALMVGSTVALAAAANYPMPFVSGSSADVAIVVGDSAASTDLTAAAALSADLSTHFAANGGRTTTTTTTTTGEAFPLFTSSTELFLNDSITTARSIITDDDLPVVLADGDFSGNVDSEYTQTITLNPVSRILFGQEPTNEDDPTIYLDIGTNAGNSLYNTTITFDQAVDFTNSDSQGETLSLFGKEWTIGSDTTNTDLVLYKSSERVLLSLGGTNPTPSRSVEVDGITYTVELVSGSDTDATIRVTDSSGSSESKEIDEDQSRKVNGIEIAVTSIDESEALGQVTAEITVASDKIVLTNGNEVQYGTDEDPIDGTLVTLSTNMSQLTTITVQVFAHDSDDDALIEGQSFVDPVYGSFKFDFSEINVPADSEDRESILVDYSGDDTLRVDMTTHTGDTKNVQWYENSTAGGALLAYGDGADERIKVFELAQINESDYVVVGNEDEGYLLELSSIQNSSDGYSDDEIEFRDVFDTTRTFSSSPTSEGAGTINIGGKQYTYTYVDATDGDGYVRLNYPDSSSNNLVVFPTIETSKGAKVSFVQPTTLSLIGGSTTGFATGTNVTGLVFPDGEDYASTLSISTATLGNVTFSGLASGTVDSTVTTSTLAVTVGTVQYNITGTGTVNSVRINLIRPDTSAAITTPSMLIWEESEDTNDREHALIVVAEGAGHDADGTGVSTVLSTAGLNGANTFTSLESNDDISELMSLYGSIVQLDTAESDQKKATIWYPDDQVQAMIYIAEGEAVIGSGSSGALGDIVFDASEVSTVSNKNLIVLGGSCINTVSAQLLGSSSPLCGADFTARTQVGSGSFLIQSFESPWNANKLALLVAGYDAQDTTNAANALRSNTVNTAEGSKYTGTTATSLTPVL